MSLFKNILQKIFGHKENTEAPIQNSDDGYLVAYRYDDPEKLEPQLKEWIGTSIQTKGPICFSWEAGGDEALITFDEERESPERQFRLEDYLIKKIDIPSAGEFEMTGSGTVYIQDNRVRVKYHSSLREMIDFDEETEEMVFSEEEVEHNDIDLFAI